MAGPIQEKLIRSWGVISTAKDSTESDPRVNAARNIRNRPIGCITGAPRYSRLLTIGNSATVYTTFAALTYTPPGGSPRALNPSTDKTVAIRVYGQGKNTLLFYNFTNRKNRGGPFYMGDDGTFNGNVNLITGSPSFEVLAVGLDDNARWYGYTTYGAIFLGNGVDANAVVQLGRTVTPGKWRTAGSNAQPAAAVIRQIAPSIATNVQASWTIPGSNQAVFDAAPFASVTAANATDTFTKVASGATAPIPGIPHNLKVNDQVLFYTTTGGGALPTGISAATAYFVIASGLTFNQFKVSATLGGAAVNFTTDGSDVGFILLNRVAAPGHTFANGNIVRLTVQFQFPHIFGGSSYLLAATDYYIVDAQVDQFGLATTLGGSALLLDINGLLQTTAKRGTTGARAGRAALTFTANLQNFPGTQGENIYVSISYNVAGYDTSVSSVMVGNGTVSDPYHYLLYTGPGFSSTDAITAFVNGDTNAVGILVASQDIPDNAEDTQSWALHQLTGGVDGGTSGGFSNQTCSVFLRYWDPGTNQLGYEGISSVKSNEIIIDALSNYDIEVSVTPDPTVELGRFGFIRVYFQFGEDALAQWNLVGEVPNATGSGAFTVVGNQRVTADIATNTFTYVGSHTSYVLDDMLHLTAPGGGTLPGGISASTPYYVINPNSTTFQVALTPGGTAVDIITTAGSNVRATLNLMRLTAQPFSDGDTLRLTTTGTLPSPLALATDYFVVGAVTNGFNVSLTPDGVPVLFDSTGSGVHTATLVRRKVLIGVSTPIGQVMEVDQNRVLPGTLAVFAGGNVWHGGITSFPTRLYPSKQANETEVFPEGANAQAYEIVRFAEGATAQRISALYSDDFKLHVHSPGGVVLIVPSDPDNRYMPNVTAGAATSSALAVWVKGRLQYLGADLQLYEIQGTRYGRQSSDFLALDAAQYVRDLVDRNQFAAHADRCFMFTDVPGQFLWYWIPGTDGSLVGFAYDQILKGTVGPFDFPKVYQLCKLEIERPEYIFADEAANMFVWNTAEQYDHGDSFPSTSTPTIHTVGSGATTPSEAGFGQVAVTGGEYWRSVTSVLETGYLDLGKPGQLKAFLGAVVSSVKGSRGVMSITVTDKIGNSQTVAYGDVAVKGIRCLHKTLCNVQDSAVKVAVTMISAEMDPWALRDLTLLLRPQGQV